MRIRVDLPEPDRPMTTKFSPGSTVKLASITAAVSPSSRSSARSRPLRRASTPREGRRPKTLYRPSAVMTGGTRAPSSVGVGRARIGSAPVPIAHGGADPIIHLRPPPSGRQTVHAPQQSFLTSTFAARRQIVSAGVGHENAVRWGDAPLMLSGRRGRTVRQSGHNYSVSAVCRDAGGVGRVSAGPPSRSRWGGRRSLSPGTSPWATVSGQPRARSVSARKPAVCCQAASAASAWCSPGWGLSKA